MIVLFYQEKESTRVKLNGALLFPNYGVDEALLGFGVSSRKGRDVVGRWQFAFGNSLWKGRDIVWFLEI